MSVQKRQRRNDSEWLEWRLQYVTASDVGKLFGVDPWGTGNQLYHHKRGADFASVKETALMRRGRELEPIILAKLQQKYPDYQFMQANDFLCDPELRLGASPDFYMIDPEQHHAIVQAKAIGGWELKRGRWTDDIPPEHVLLQILTELKLSDAAYGWVIAFKVDEWDLHEPYRVDRYPEVENEIGRRAAAFMAAVDQGKEPPVDFARDASLLAARYRNITPGKTVDLRADNRAPELCRTYLKITDQIKAFTEARDAVQAELVEKIGDAEIAQIVGFDVTRKTISRKGYWAKPTSYPKLTILADADEDTEAAS